MKRWLTLTQLTLLFSGGCYASDGAPPDPPAPRVAIDGCVGEGEARACSFEVVIDSVDPATGIGGAAFEGLRLHLYAQGADEPASLVILDRDAHFHNGGRDGAGPTGVFEAEAYEPGPLVSLEDESLTVYSLRFDGDLRSGQTGSMSGQWTPDVPMTVEFHVEADVEAPSLDAPDVVMGRTAGGRVLPWGGLTVISTEPIAGPDVRALANPGVTFSEPFSGTYRVGLAPDGWWPSAESATIEVDVSDPSGNASTMISVEVPLVPYGAPAARIDFDGPGDVFAWGEAAPRAGECADGGCLALSLTGSSSGFFVVVGGEEPVQTVSFSARLIAPAGSVEHGDAGAVLGWLTAERDAVPDADIWPAPTHELSAAPGADGYDSGFATVRIDLPAPTTATGIFVQLQDVPLVARNPSDGVVLIDRLRAE